MRGIMPVFLCQVGLMAGTASAGSIPLEVHADWTVRHVEAVPFASGLGIGLDGDFFVGTGPESTSSSAILRIERSDWSSSIFTFHEFVGRVRSTTVDPGILFGEPSLVIMDVRTACVGQNDFQRHFSDDGDRTLYLGLDQPGMVVALTRLACLGDLDADGSIGLSDLLPILAAWGSCGSCPQDLDGDGLVGFSDLLQSIGRWGPCG